MISAHFLKQRMYSPDPQMHPLNGYNIDLSNEQSYNMVMQVAQGEMSKEALASLLEQHIVRSPP